MFVAIAALLITTMKTSEGIIATVYAGANSGNSLNILGETYMREAEDHVGHAQMVQHRRANIGGA